MTRRAPSPGLAFVLQLWVCVWLLVTALAVLVELGLGALGLAPPLPVRTLLLTAVMVPAMVYGILPLLHRLRSRAQGQTASPPKRTA
ncbi:MAG: hypothetical protein AB7D51_06200 [Desulfovibrionaceae bacterium]